jgi:penicillin-binding protein 2
MYKRRLIIFLTLIACIFAVLIATLAHLQLIRGEQLRREYERSTREIQLLPAVRGAILDRQGRVLADDQPCMQLCLRYELLVEDPAWQRAQIRRIAREEDLEPAHAEPIFRERVERTWQLAREAAELAGEDLEENVRTIVETVRRWRRNVGGPIREERQAHPVVDALEAGAAVEIDARLKSLARAGATLRPSHRRSYPYGDLACHLVGVTGQVSPAEIDARNRPESGENWLAVRRRNYEPGDMIGKSGVEKRFEEILRGVRGYRVIDTGGLDPEQLRHEPSEPGRDVHLTLDGRLQQMLAERLRRSGHLGAAVVLDVRRSELLAAVSLPTYNLNRYREEAGRLFSDEVNLPLLDRAIGRGYPPGSTVKPLIALAGLIDGEVSPTTTLHCAGRLFPGVNAWRCTGTHGDIACRESIQHSCNVYYYRLGERLGSPAICAWLERFGFGRPPGTGLPGETAGLVPTARWLRENRDRDHRPGDARLLAIGQGELLASPLQVASAVAAIARGGVYRPVRIALEAPEPSRESLQIPREVLDVVRGGMYDVCNEYGGTGYRAFQLAVLDVEVAGKSGTAQCSPQTVFMEIDGDRRMRVVREGNMTWFVGYAPAERPRIAFAVVLEYVQDGGGGSVAGPVAADLVGYCDRLGYFAK